MNGKRGFLALFHHRNRKGIACWTALAVCLLGSLAAAQETTLELWRDRYDSSTGVGGPNPQHRDDVATMATVDGAGNIYIAGFEQQVAGSFPVRYGIILSLDPEGNRSRQEAPPYLEDIAVDAAGNVYTIATIEASPGHRIYTTRLGAGGWSVELDHQHNPGAGQYPNDFALGIAVGTDGNVYIAGTYQTCPETGCVGGKTAVVAKYRASDGLELWQQVATDGNWPADMALDGSDNVLITGVSSTVKYDSAGSEVCSVSGRGYAIDAAPGGYFYVGALEQEPVWDYENEEWVWRDQLKTTRYDPVCSAEWSHTWGENDDDQLINVVATDNDGAVYVVGFNEAENQGALLRYSAAGTLIWESTWWGGIDVSTDQAGNAYIGRSESGAWHIVKYAVADGHQVWETTVELGGGPLELLFDTDNNVIVVGNTPALNIPQPNQANSDIFTIKFSQLADFDGDAVPNDLDNCPLEGNPGQEDADSDGPGDVCDNCPLVANPGQEDGDSDGPGDVCDNCLLASNPGQEDADSDGTGDSCDNCLNTTNADQSDIDSDGRGDVCDNCVDVANGSSIGRCIQGGIGNLCTINAHCGPGGVCSISQEDADSDGRGDACETDDDNDGIADPQDNCRTIFNPSQIDTDSDGVGNACNSAIDQDGDGWADALDNCPDTVNPSQVDLDGNGVGDACEYDLSISRVEFVQVIQDENNSVPLVAGKDTWIRVYFDIGPGVMPIGPVSGILRFKYANGLPMLTYVNGIARSLTVLPEKPIMAPPVPDPAKIEDTLVFHIPGSWQWDATPYVDITTYIGGSAIQETDPFNNNYNGPMVLNAMPPLNLQFVPIYGCANIYVPGYSACPPPTEGDFWDMANVVKKMFPVARINVDSSGEHHQTNDPTESWFNAHSLYAYLVALNTVNNDSYDDMKYVGVVCQELDPNETFLSGDYAVGLGWGDEAWTVRTDHNSSTTLGGVSMAHELIHTLLDVNDDWHVFWSGHVESDCNPDGPYFDGYPDSNPPGLIDAYGYDGERVYPADSTFEVMTYAPCPGTSGECLEGHYLGGACTADADCPPSASCGSAGFCEHSVRGRSCGSENDCETDGYCSGRWISKYMYTRLFNKIGSMRRADLDEPKVSIATDQDYLAAMGVITGDSTVDSLSMRRLVLPVGTDDGTGSGSYSLELDGVGSDPLFVRSFEPGGPPPTGDPDEIRPFRQILPFHPETQQIVIKHDFTVLDTIPVSANPPEVTVLYPNGGESLSGEVDVTWTGVDADGDDLTYDVLHSPDGGVTWEAVAVGLGEMTFLWNTDSSAGSDSALLKVVANDGANSGHDLSDATFSVANKDPRVTILSPADDSVFFLGQTISFTGAALDPGEGSLDDSALSWSSSINGPLASGREITIDDLAEGEHDITLTAQDSLGGIGVASIRVHISGAADADGDEVGDDVDNCLEAHNPGQEDTDSDGVGDACDEGDPDSDGFVDYLDNCPGIANDQQDLDGDAVGDACDNCIDLPNFAQLNQDQDGHGDSCDCSTADPSVYPGAVEICDGVDNDCDDSIDEECVELCTAATAWNSATRVSDSPGGSGFPNIVWTGTQYGVAWHDASSGNYEIYFARLSPTGATLGSTVAVTGEAAASGHASLAWTGIEFGVAWHDDRDGNREIYFRRLDAEGNKLGPALRITDDAGDSADADLVWNGKEYGLAWHDDRDGNSHIYFVRLDPLGSKIGTETLVSEAEAVAYYPSMASNGSEFGVMWSDDRHGASEIYFSRIGASGAKLGTDVRITTEGWSGQPVLVGNGTGYGAVWHDDRDGNWEIYFARLYADGTKAGTETRLTNDSATSGWPWLAWTGSEYGVSWHDSRGSVWEVYYATVDPSGNKVGSDIQVTSTSLGSYATSSAWSGDAYGMVWHDERDGNFEIYFSRVGCCGDADADGYAACAGDCDDRRADRNPGQAELCDGLDNDCDGVLPANERDLDVDGVMACGDDCDDSDATIYGGAPEINDGQDNQCPGSIDYGLTDEMSGVAGFTGVVDKDTYSWTPQAGATVYAVVRASAPDFSVDCTTTTTGDSQWVDSADPPAFAAFYYLVRPIAPHIGSWGRTSWGAERTLACP